MTSTGSVDPPEQGRTLTMKPPVAYFGGKTRVAGRIAAQLPAHLHYVEPFGGSLAVLLAKAPSRWETVNDLDGDLMTFWRVLRNRTTELVQVCALTPHSRAEMLAARERPEGLDELERARRVWVLLSQGRTGTLLPTGWRHHTKPAASTTSMPRYLVGYIGRMAPVAERLARVSLECRPALDLIHAYGQHPGVLLYVDPPYLGATRSRNYRHELDRPDEHRELAHALRRCAATVVLSGYPHPLYDHELYPDWHRIEIATGTSQGGQWSARTEVLWSNRDWMGSAMPDPAGEHEPAAEDLFTVAEPSLTCNETASGGRAELLSCNETRCLTCRADLPPHTRGRKRRFCSTACRVRAHRAAKESA